MRKPAHKSRSRQFPGAVRGLAGLLVASAALAYLLVPVLLTGHVLASHGDHAHAASDEAGEPQSPHQPVDEVNCDVCSLLGTVAASGAAIGDESALPELPAGGDRLWGALEIFCGCDAPIAAMPRAPPIG